MVKLASGPVLHGHIQITSKGMNFHPKIKMLHLYSRWSDSKAIGEMYS